MKHLSFCLVATIMALLALSSCNYADKVPSTRDLRNDLAGTYHIDSAVTFISASNRALRIYSSTTERASPLRDSSIIDTGYTIQVSKVGLDNFSFDLKLPNNQVVKVPGFGTALPKADSITFTVKSTEFDARTPAGLIDSTNRNSVILTGTTADLSDLFAGQKNVASGFLRLATPNKLYVAITGFHKQYRYRDSTKVIDTVYQTPFTIRLKATKHN